MVGYWLKQRGDEEEAVCTVKSEGLLQKRGELELRNI